MRADKFKRIMDNIKQPELAEYMAPAGKESKLITSADIEAHTQAFLKSGGEIDELESCGVGVFDHSTSHRFLFGPEG